jgi:hypothetical protein
MKESHTKKESEEKKVKEGKEKTKKLFLHFLCHSLTKYPNPFFKHIC